MKPPPLQGEGWGGDGVPARRGGVEETHPHLHPPLEGQDFRPKPPPLKGRTPRQEAFDRCPTPHPDRKSALKGKSVSARVDLGGRGNIKKKKTNINIHGLR